jgi:hypothetical protein
MIYEDLQSESEDGQNDFSIEVKSCLNFILLRNIIIYEEIEEKKKSL